MTEQRAAANTTAKSTTKRPGPLAGMRVIELGQVMAMPTAGLMLADMGAEVLKVEKLPGGDDSRNYREPRINGVAAPFLILNRNKRGMALNLKSPRGREVLLRMVKKADVLTENFRPGTLEKLGIGYDTLKEINPGLIYCAVSGYGRTGPYGDKAGFDLIAQGFAGLMSITGVPGGPPVKSGGSVADINAGILAATGIIAAYVHKLKTGEGQVVEASLFEAALQQTYWQAAIFFATGKSAGPTGSAHVITAPYQAFKAKDGWINIGGATPANWERIAVVLGHPEWKQDPRFIDNTARMKNLDALSKAMDAELARDTVKNWVAIFDKAGVPAGPVHTIGEVLTHPQTLARDMVVEMDHPKAGRISGLGSPIKFSKTEGGNRYPPPMLGEHTREILGEHGYSAAEIDSLIAEGVVAAEEG